MKCTVEEALKRGWLKPEDVKPKVLKAAKDNTPQALAQAAIGKPVGKKPNARDMEGQEQTCLIKQFRFLYPGVGDLLIHIPNGGSRKNAYEGWRLKEQGVRKGVSDLFLPVARGGYFGFWLEFKASPPYDSPPSAEQLEWLALMRAQGYHAELCIGLDAAMSCLNAYMALPSTD